MSLLQSSSIATTGTATAPRPTGPGTQAPTPRRSWTSYRRMLRTWLIVQDLVLSTATGAAVCVLVNDPVQTPWVLSTCALLVLTSWASGTLVERVLAEASSGWRRVLAALPVTVMTVLIAAQVVGLQVPRAATLVAAPAATTAMVAGRALVKSHLRRRRMDGHGLRRTLVLVGEGGETVLRGMRQHPGDGFLLVGSVSSPHTVPLDRAPRLLGTVEQLHDVVIAHDIDVVITVGGVHPADHRAAVRAVEGTSARFIMMAGLSNVAPHRVHSLPSASSWTGAVEVDARRPERLSKKVADRVVGSLLALLALPVIAVAAVAVRMTDHGPAFYTQTRVGKDGTHFTMYKLRSMYVDADARRAAVLAAQQATSGQGNEVLFKSVDDPRITPVGRVIRRFSIDELPQILNVVLGDMSLIGPRPALPEEVAKYDDEARRRLLVRPGMTGLWQVSGRSDLSWERSVELDQHYVDNSSTVLDLHITAATVSAVLGGKGAY